MVYSDVCDALLDKTVPDEKRHIRAEAILMIGRIFRAAERDASQQSDNGDYMFEELLASSQKKKTKATSSANKDTSQ
jgi:X-domain of DnaJ-containing